MLVESKLKFQASVNCEILVVASHKGKCITGKLNDLKIGG